MHILVIGATGNVGSHVVDVLLADGHQVRALTRQPDKAARWGGRIDVRTGDLNAPEALGPVFAGIEGLFLLNGLTPSETQEGLAALEWARRAGVARLVYQSVHSVERAPHVPHFGGKLAIEHAVRRSGIEYTILQPNSFFQNDAALKGAIVEHGIYPNPIGGIGASRVDVRDIADAAGRAFAGAAVNEAVPVSGPEVLTGEACAGVYARLLGRPVQYAGADLDSWEGQMRQVMPGWLAFDLRIMFEYIQQHGLRATDAELQRLEALLGRPPRRFDAYARELLGLGA